MALTVSVTPAPGAIGDLAAVAAAGGSLSYPKTYYYCVVPIRNNNSALQLCYRECAYGPISNLPAAVTTDATNRKVNLTWSDPAGATGFVVLRSETPGVFSGSSARIQGTSYSYATVGTGGAYTDDGGRSMTYPTVLSILPAGTLLPGGFDPRTNGAIACEFYGDASSYDLEDLYNALVGAYPNHVYWDGNTFGFLGNLYTHSSNQIILVDKSRVWYQLGCFRLYSTHGSSLFAFGELSNGRGIKGLKYYNFSGHYMIDTLYRDAIFYGQTFHLAPLEGGSTGYFNVYATVFGNSAELVDCVVSDSSVDFKIQDSVFVKNFMHASYIGGYSSSHFKLFQEIICTYIYISNMSTISWINDRFIYTQSSYALYYYQTSSDGGGYLIDCQWPNIIRSDGLPEIYWRSTCPAGNKVYCCASLILKIKSGGSALSGAALSLKTAADVTLTDVLDGASLSGLTSDNNGYIWLEKITVNTGASTTSIPAKGSPGWTTDEYKGRHFHLNRNGKLYGPVKVKSNTADTLTLCEALPFTPAEDDLGGLAIWVPWGYLNHKNGTGAGYGASYTDYTTYNNIKLAITKAGYSDYEDQITVTGPQRLEVDIEQPTGGVSPTQFGLTPLGVKQGVV